MGGKHRIVLGGIRDAREGAERQVGVNTINRLITAIDADYNNACQQKTINTRLRKLKNRNLKYFAQQVLSGRSQSDLIKDFNIHRSTFHRRMKKILKIISTP